MKSAERRAEKLFEKGKAAYQLERYPQAIAAFESAIELVPNAPNSHFLLGVSRFNSGNIGGALIPFARCVYLEPGHRDARNGLGMALQSVGFSEQAAAHLARAAYEGNPQAPGTLAEMKMDFCRQCGGPLTTSLGGASPASPMSDCLRCAGEPPALTSPRQRTWSWAHRPPEDYRSQLSLPGAQLAQLGRDHRSRYARDGDADDIDQAITYLELAVATTVPVSESAERLTELGVAYRERFANHGLPADLDHAIDCHEQAIAIAPRAPGYHATLSSLGLAYSERYRHGGSAGDLDRAVALLDRALTSLPADPDHRTAILANAGMIYSRRFELSRTPSDLKRSVELLEQAVAATPDDHPRLAVRLSNLATAVEASDPGRAIALCERAVAATPDGDRRLYARLGNLGRCRLNRYDRTGLNTDLTEGLAALRRAAAATPDGDPELPSVLSQLAAGYLRAEPGRKGIDQLTVRALIGRLSTARNASPRARVQAGGNLGTLANAIGDHATAVEVLDAAVTLLPAVAAREADWADREHRFGEFAGLVSQAVAAHCAIGDPTGAAEIAELGRGILLAAQLDSRTDLTELDRQLPHFADSFRRVRDMLNVSSPGQAGNRAELWTRYENLVSQIRERPGFGRFLCTPQLLKLRHAAHGGTVVMVNSGREQADAILIGADGDPVPVPLPDLAPADISAMAGVLLSTIRASSGPAQLLWREDLKEVLGWLWKTIALPVSKALPPANGPQRIWWLPVGPLGVFPLHAAGHPGKPGALDAFVSSYIPTLRMLAYAHDRPPAGARRQLTVALAHTPGLPDLRGTIAEALNLVRDRPAIPPLLNWRASVDEVRAALPAATWVHFACHATADYGAPSKGGLRLNDGMLTIPEVSRLQLADAELAYLSACSTAHRSLVHADESINLASAFHLAGFRHVMASLWPLEDDFAADASQRFYDALKQGHSAADAALALHQVIRGLRTEYPDRPDLWAALIHSGP
ncbi:hypothetical protein GCM10027176_33640 [Actinoallomurus bryophytorum]|uniref:CHAT domain-containing protein n=1 Tax=Actinoallomurus bryophytorum TaxID=1490222 RepID=A0A543CMX5_9ACTN|nr:CHAT domain-containing protein [Actinoallomurus bryophytorum]TQL98439.1 CHAT domain-containing protein [Actinoallomurus bryophytorum]